MRLQFRAALVTMSFTPSVVGNSVQEALNYTTEMARWEIQPRKMERLGIKATEWKN